MVVVGVDPGRKTGIAVLDVSGARPRCVEAVTTPLEDVAAVWRWGQPEIVCIETACYFRGPRGPGLLSAARAGGVVEGALLALGITYARLSPPEWRTRLGLRGNVRKSRAWGLVAAAVDDAALATNEHERDAVGIALAASRADDPTTPSGDSP